MTVDGDTMSIYNLYGLSRDMCVGIRVSIESVEQVKSVCFLEYAGFGYIVCPSCN